MKAEDHIIAWIESSRPHYDRLLEIERKRQPGAIPGFASSRGLMLAAVNLVYSAYGEMLECGDALRSDEYSPAELLEAARLVTVWELEQ